MVKHQAGETMDLGGLTVTCLGTDKNGLTSWITGGDGLAAKPISIDWSKISSTPSRTVLSSYEKVQRASVARQNLKAVAATLNPLERDLETWQQWQPTEPNKMFLMVATSKGFKLESGEQGYRLVKN